ncbi:10201_t:CDS:1 [Funneliformis geosporum]|uniref:10201_t:CDS:1 n=1 Tax=Funneliformis geosporum TaxID=1117311 RepID=A0A9W4SFT1_9GLOM|nr:10201_t:CDS:1 [Funneliformis geosporum]
MTIYSLPEDCFYEIFKHVKDDTTLLYNCLFANRFLCRIIIPFLYQNPFSVVNGLRQYYCLTRTYLSCLDDEERNHLKKHFIKFPQGSNSLFDYAKYLEEIPNLTIAAECWLIYLNYSSEEKIYINYNEYNKQLDKEKKLILQEILFHLFLRKIKNCKMLNIQANLFDKNVFNIKFFKEIISHNSSITSLRLIISEEEINDSNEELFLKFISLLTKKCFDIEELEVTTFYFYYNSILQGLIEILIQNQKNFKSVSLSYPNDRSLNDIIKIIEMKRHTLTTIHIDNSYNFINQNVFKAIANCEKVEKLEFINVKGLGLLKTREIFCNSTFELKEFINLYDRLTPFFHIRLIRKFGHSLNRLSLYKVTQLTIRQISELCLNLKILQIVCKDINLSAYQYFRNMKIQQLIIYSEEHLLSNYYSNIFKSIAENLPDSLTTFTIYIKDPNSIFLSENNCISFDNLEMFLNHYKVGLYTLNCNFNLRIENIEQILDHVKKRKNLRYLGIRSPPGYLWFNNDRVRVKQLLNEIREYDIEINTIKNHFSL